MTTALFLLAFLVGAGAEALWLEQRLARLAPQSLRVVAIHIGVGTFLCGVALPVAMGIVIGTGGVAGRVAAIMGVAFPVLVYCCLTAVWSIRVSQGMLRGGLR